MEIIIQQSDRAASVLAAKIVAAKVRQKPDAVLGLATGDTPLMLYEELVAMHRNEGLDFARVTTFNLDEYFGLPEQHPSTYRHYMEEYFFKRTNIDLRRTFLPVSAGRDVEADCRQFEEKIKECGGIDIQILGVGQDGHIGFNEPSSSLASRTRIKTLTQETRKNNAKFFSSPDEVPKHCITMGIGTIMESKQVLLLAFGSKKSQVVAQLVEGPLTAMVPASILQFHPQAKILLDDSAAAQLRRRDYYEWVYSNKPNWQKN